MAITNHERVGKALVLLKVGLAPFVEREFKNLYKAQALAEAQKIMTSERLDANRPFAAWDAAVLLRLMWEAWNDVFPRPWAGGATCAPTGPPRSPFPPTMPTALSTRPAGS